MSVGSAAAVFLAILLMDKPNDRDTGIYNTPQLSVEEAVVSPSSSVTESKSNPIQEYPATVKISERETVRPQQTVTSNDIKEDKRIGNVVEDNLIAENLEPKKENLPEQIDSPENVDNRVICDNEVDRQRAHRSFYGSLVLTAGQSPMAGIDEPVSFATRSSSESSSYYHTYYPPVKVGITFNLPVADRISINTGLIYSLYMTKYSYGMPMQRGESILYAHYIGIPVQVNWHYLSTNRLDLYIGAGVEKDFFLGATLSGSHLKKDAGIVSLQCNAGAQFNISKRIGLYLEPSVNWATPSDKRLIEIYPNDHPLSFMVTGGVRVNLADSF